MGEELKPCPFCGRQPNLTERAAWNRCTPPHASEVALTTALDWWFSEGSKGSYGAPAWVFLAREALPGWEPTA